MADKRKKPENTHKQQVSEGDTLLAVGACDLWITRKGGVWEDERIEDPH